MVQVLVRFQPHTPNFKGNNMIILSCGHEVDDFNKSFNVLTKATSRDGEKAISYSCVCGACEDMYRQHGEIFDTEAKAYEWLNKEMW